MGCRFQCFDAYQSDRCYWIVYWVYRWVSTLEATYHFFLFRSYGEDICTDNKINKKRKSHWDYGSYGSCCYAWCCVYEFTRHYLPSLGIRNDFYFHLKVGYLFFTSNRLNSKILKSTNYRNFLLPNEFRYNFGWNRSWVDFHSSYIGILRSQCKQSIAVWAATRGY